MPIDVRSYQSLGLLACQGGLTTEPEDMIGALGNMSQYVSIFTLMQPAIQYDKKLAHE